MALANEDERSASTPDPRPTVEALRRHASEGAHGISSRRGRQRTPEEREACYRSSAWVLHCGGQRFESPQLKPTR